MAPTNVLRNLRKLMTQKCMKILGTSKKQFNKRKRTKLLLGFLKATKLFRWKLVTEKRMHRGLKLLSRPSKASKRWFRVYKRYRSMIKFNGTRVKMKRSQRN